MTSYSNFESPPPPPPPAPYSDRQQPYQRFSSQITDSPLSQSGHPSTSSPSLTAMSAHNGYYSAGAMEQPQQRQYHQQVHQPAPASAYGQPMYDSQQGGAYQQHSSSPVNYPMHGNTNNSYGMGIYQPLSSNGSNFSAVPADAQHMMQQQQQQGHPQHHDQHQHAQHHHHHHASHGAYQQTGESMYSHHNGGGASLSGHHGQDGMSGPSPSPTSASAQLMGSPNGLPHGMRPKRRQVKNACINCQKACKKCDEGRPCTRCIKYGLTDTCIDSMRKERKRGIKRGPYKRRATTGSSNVGQGSSSAPSHSNSYDGQSHQVKSEGSFASPQTGSYDVTGYGMPSSSAGGSSSYRSLAGPSSSNYGFSNGSNGTSTTSYGAAPSPSLYGARSNNSTNAWNASPAAGGFSQQQPQQPNSFNAPNGLSMYSQEIRSSSAPIAAQGSPVSATFSQSGRPAMITSPASYSAHPLPSPSAISTMLGSGGRSGTGNSLFSPPALPPTAGSYLNASSSSSSHSRLHSDSGLAYSSSSGSTANFSSPRTPLSAGGNDLNSQVSLSGDGGAGAGPYLKSPSSYVHHPPPTTASVMSGFAPGATQHQQAPSSLSIPRPFPLQMPQLPRSRGGGSRDMMNAQNIDVNVGSQHQSSSRLSAPSGAGAELVRLEA